MRNFLKNYIITLKVLSPTFIGSGDSINKKEYIFLPHQRRAIIPNLHQLYDYLSKKGVAAAFENYLLKENIDLHIFLKQIGITEKEYSHFSQYSVETGNAVFDTKSKKEIHTFVKDPYGNPYLPGSSLKGALRTALLSRQVMQNQSAYDRLKNDIKGERGGSKKWFLSGQIKEVENKAFLKLPYESKRMGAEKDVLRGLRLADSLPVSTDDLVLCQKIDVSVKGSEKPINTLRECLKPDTLIRIPLTLDEGLFPWSIEEVLKAVQSFYHQYENNFLKAFPQNKTYEGTLLYLGGGAGFATKTVMYPLFGKAEGLKQVTKIMEKTTPPQHHHQKDEGIGVSPHMKKCTRYAHALHEFGACHITIE